MRAHLLRADVYFSTQLRYAERPGPLRSLAIFLAHSGDSWFWGLGLLLLWWLGGPAWKTRAVVFVIGIGFNAILVQIIKRVVKRARPEGDWGRIYRNADPHSFPSGHAARMTMLIVLASALGPSGLAALLLVWAPLVALARVAMGVHYLSDVAVGAMLGLVVGLLIVVALRVMG